MGLRVRRFFGYYEYRTGATDGTQARKGYALNRMCFSLNSAESRQAFLADEAGYCDRFGLNEHECRSVQGQTGRGGRIGRDTSTGTST